MSYQYIHANGVGLTVLTVGHNKKFFLVMAYPDGGGLPVYVEMVWDDPTSSWTLLSYKTVVKRTGVVHVRKLMKGPIMRSVREACEELIPIPCKINTPFL